MVEKIIEVKVSSLTPGDILAGDVYNLNGKILVPKETVLTENTIAGLKRYFIYSVRIYKSVNMDAETIEVDLKSILKKEAEEIIDTQIKKQVREDKFIDTHRKLILEVLGTKKVFDLLLEMRALSSNLFRHSVAVAYYALAIGKELYYPDNRLVILATAALMHDAGMLGLPKELYTKEGGYNEEEKRLVRRHPNVGLEILKEAAFNQEIYSIVAGHHERYDGSGYPNGFTNEKIHVMSKIIGTADVFDGLITEKPYRPRHRRSDTIEYMLGTGNMQFNHEIVEALLNTIIIFPYGQWVELSTKEIAIIIDEETKKFNLRPKVLITFDPDGKKKEEPVLMDLALRENIHIQINRVV